MPVIRISELAQVDDGFRARLSVADREYEITVDDRFFDIKEAELEWYFEQWLQFPMLNKVKAEEVAATIKGYGQQLFEQVFKSNLEAYAEYVALRGNLETLRFEIVGDNPDFQALHWEALRDTALPRPLAVDCVMVQRSRQAAAKMPAMQSSPTINLLLVTARPYQNDAVYRTISRPLIEAIANSQLPVKIDLLRPATFESLSRHLKDKGQGHYHIIHFDCHGALLNYKRFNSSKDEKKPKPEPSPLTFKQQERYGRGEIAPYEGVKAFLVLEGDGDGEEDLVEATEMAALLTGQNIPVCILNACQSGKQLGATESFVLGQEEDYRETSLGSRLMAAGMQMVVAMGYSVTVTAAEVMMQQVYQQIFARQPMEKAVQLGRWELFQQKGRRASFNQTIPLEDWLLPVVYGSQQVNLNLREFQPAEKEQYLLNRRRKYRFQKPEYDFFGRDIDILKIERALSRHNFLLLQGMGGTGKSTLLRYLHEWWQTTNFTDQVFYFGYDKKAWTVEQIVSEIGTQLFDRFDSFSSLMPEAKEQAVIDKLCSESHLLILDNLESITGQRLAIKNTLSKPKQAKLRDFLGRLAGGKTRVIFGSRCAEDWLKAVTFQQNIYGLRGLDPEARTQLAQKILQFHVPKRVQEIEADPEFTRLMKVLAGYPLALEVVLPNLRQESPAEILVGLQVGDLDLDSGSEDKTKSILKCVEYSHSNLSPDAQKLLICLAPFSGFIDRGVLPNYAEELQKLAPFADYDFEGFDGAIQEAINWGLLEGMDPEKSLLTIQPIFPYFLKTKAATMEEATRQALQEGFKNHYQGMAGSYNQLMSSKDAQEQQLGIFFCRLEYENLYNVLQTCLANQESTSVYTLWIVFNNYLSLINNSSQKLKLSQYVYSKLKGYPVSLKNLELNLFLLGLADTLANNYLELKEYREATRVCRDNLETILALKDTPEQFNQSLVANTYHLMGRVAQEFREYEEARENYKQALSIYIELSDRPAQARTYHELGIVAQLLRKYGEAQENYQQALSIKTELSDRPAQANTYYQLAMVAQELRKYGEAQENYQQALSIFIEFDDCPAQARTYHQLGTVFQELREYREARENYQHALSIFIEFDDRYSQGIIYQSLGRVAEELSEFPEAKNNFLQALAICHEFKDGNSIQSYSFPSFSRLYQATQDETLLESMAQILGITPEAAQQLIS